MFLLVLHVPTICLREKKLSFKHALSGFLEDIFTLRKWSKREPPISSGTPRCPSSNIRPKNFPTESRSKCFVNFLCFTFTNIIIFVKQVFWEICTNDYVIKCLSFFWNYSNRIQTKIDRASGLYYTHNYFMQKPVTLNWPYLLVQNSVKSLILKLIFKWSGNKILSTGTTCCLF